MENKDFTISKVRWITKMKSTPPLTEEYIKNEYLRYETMMKFLQNNGLTTRIVLKDGDIVDDESKLMQSDLNEEGSEFYKKGIIPWIKKIDRSKDPEKAIKDVSFLEKKLNEMRNG